MNIIYIFTCTPYGWQHFNMTVISASEYFEKQYLARWPKGNAFIYEVLGLNLGRDTGCPD
jgi:hypothetical protein